MLVLSRRPGQCITFPTLDISVRVLEAGRGSVRLGIDAPRDVTILRQELAGAGEVTAPARRDHARRGRLHTAMTALYLAEMQFQAGQLGDAEASLAAALRALEALDGALAVRGQPPRGAGQAIQALLVEDDHNEEA